MALTLTLSVHVNEFILIITHLLISHFKYIFQGKKYCLKYHELLIHKYHYVSGEWHRTCFIIKRSNYLRFDIKSAGLYCHFLFFFCFFGGGFSACFCFNFDFCWISWNKISKTKNILIISRWNHFMFEIIYIYIVASIPVPDQHRPGNTASALITHQQHLCVMSGAPGAHSHQP